MPVIVKFDPNITQQQAAVIPDASPRNDGVMTAAMAAKLASLSPGGGGSLQDAYNAGRVISVAQPSETGGPVELLNEDLDNGATLAEFRNNVGDAFVSIIDDNNGGRIDIRKLFQFGIQLILNGGNTGNVLVYDDGLQQWAPAASAPYVADPTAWDAPPPTDVQGAITRIAALVVTLNGGTPIP
jgi:hypothetical protein